MEVLLLTCYKNLWLFWAMARLKLVQNERSIHSLLNTIYFPQFGVQNFKLYTKMNSHPIRLQDCLIINISVMKIVTEKS